MIKINCIECGNEKSVYHSQIKKGEGKFCSQRCSSINMNRNRNKPVLDRIMDNIEIDNNECWIYQRNKNRKGYGIISYKGIGQGVHRVMYMLSNKVELSANDIIMHTCDNPPCCNPTHLKRGTYNENNQDRHLKGRNAYGLNNGNSKLNEKIVNEIRNLYLSGDYGYKRLAKKFNIHDSQVRKIIIGENWASIIDDPEYFEKVKELQKRGFKKEISQKLIDEIRNLFDKDKITYSSLSREFGIPRTTIVRIINKEGAYKDI